MPDSSRKPGLRPGQHEALSRWRGALERGSRSELVVVPVGYGKTVIGSGSFGVASELVGADLCLYLTPADLLRQQVYGGFERALAMAGFSMPIRKLLAENRTAQRILATRANVVVATYQQVAANPVPYIRLCASRRVHLVCDEAHHLGERGTWAAQLAKLSVTSRILLSATPVRLDRDALAGARYVQDDEGQFIVDPMLNVSLRQAWKERRILKRLNLQMKDYRVELQDPDGDVLEFTASEMAELDDFDQRCVRQQLRWNEDYVAPLVREFADALRTKQQAAPGEHQGLVFAATTEHANHLQRVFDRFSPDLRVTVVHSADMPTAAVDQRMQTFHRGDVDVLIQVKKASEGFDAPRVSVLLKLDAVHSRGPVIQQLGRGLRFNHSLSETANVLHVFIGRDPRMQSIVEYLERELPPGSAIRVVEGEQLTIEQVDDPVEDEAVPDDEDPRAGPSIVDVEEAGDTIVDEQGRLVHGQQLSMFGLPAGATAASSLRREETAIVTAEVVDLEAELREAIRFCNDWTARAARERSKRYGAAMNHFQALNAAFSRDTGLRGTLTTPAQYRTKGDWMKARYVELIQG